jgi:hypothetical protein
MLQGTLPLPSHCNTWYNQVLLWEKLTYERKRGEGEFSRLQMRGIAAGFAERSSASRAGDGRRSGRPLRRRYGGAPIGTPLVLHLLWNFMKIYINFLLASGKSVRKDPDPNPYP